MPPPRHGARTPLTALYDFNATWTHCSNHYAGVEVELFDEDGLPTPPPITDEVRGRRPSGSFLRKRQAAAWHTWHVRD